VQCENVPLGTKYVRAAHAGRTHFVPNGTNPNRVKG